MDMMIKEGGGTASEWVSLVRSFSLVVAVGILFPFYAVGAEPDVLISTGGEKLVGQLESATATTVTFSSQIAGEVTVAWTKVKELHSTRRFAVIPKNVIISNARQAKGIPVGTISVADKRIQITPSSKAAPRTASIADSGHVVDQEDFRRTFESPGLFGDWGGSISAGTSLFLATQRNATFDGEVTLERAVPGVDWRTPSSLTTLDFSTSYSWSRSTLPAISSKVKTFIYQADAERDQYLAGWLFGFGQMIYNHNVSQNLSLGQTYFGGLGVTAWRTPTQDLDFKASLGYVQRLYYQSAFNRSLLASSFGERYRNKRMSGVEFHQEASFIPAWNNSEAYAAVGTAGLAIPLFGDFSLGFDSLDYFLNGVPAGYKKNSFQLSVDLTYTLSSSH